MQDADVDLAGFQMSCPSLKLDLSFREYVDRVKERYRKQYNLNRYSRRQWDREIVLRWEFSDNTEYYFREVGKPSDNERGWKLELR